MWSSVGGASYPVNSDGCQAMSAADQDINRHVIRRERWLPSYVTPISGYKQVCYPKGLKSWYIMKLSWNELP